MSCISMSRLHCWRRRDKASGIEPSARATTRARSRHDRARSGAHAVVSSASHSARNSRRAQAGVSRATHAINRRSTLSMTGARAQPAEILEPLHGRLERCGAGGGDLVITACGTLLPARDLLALPVRLHEPERIEPPQRGIDGAGLKPGAVRDVEAVACAVGNGVQHERRGIGDVVAHHCGTLYNLISI